MGLLIALTILFENFSKNYYVKLVPPDHNIVKYVGYALIRHMYMRNMTKYLKMTIFQNFARIARKLKNTVYHAPMRHIYGKIMVFQLNEGVKVHISS